MTPPVAAATLATLLANRPTLRLRSVRHGPSAASVRLSLHHRRRPDWCAPAPAAAEWKRLDSPNFVVVGDVGAGDLKNIARRFEAFRETVSQVLTPAATATAVPTVVMVFPSDNAFTPFKRRQNGKPVGMTGLFMPRQDANYIAIVRDLNENAMRGVFHERAPAHLEHLGRCPGVAERGAGGVPQHIST